MINMKEILYQKVRNAMSAWDEQDIYAVSFFVESNELFTYRDYSNVSGFAISYNTESDCEGAGSDSEERWNYAFWRQDETAIIEPVDGSPEMKLLFEWYQENEIENIGEEPATATDGPVGYKELVALVAEVARRLQDEGFLKEKFGRPIPIIIHDLEYIDCTWKATEYANPNGEAADFLRGSWRSCAFAPIAFPGPGRISEIAKQVLNDPQMQARLFAVSPGLPQEYLMEMLKKLEKE